MAHLIVNGGKPLTGTISPSGNKNSILPIFCASLLTNEMVVIRNVPDITDLQKLVNFCEALGSVIHWDKPAMVMETDHSAFGTEPANEEIPHGMRSAVLLFAPLLFRLKRLKIRTNAKGCALGVREIDPHLEVFSGFGVEVEMNAGVELSLYGRYRGQRHWQDYISVTTTESFLMAAVVAEGDSSLINAAGEPHVQDLCNFLQSMGAGIEGGGSSVLSIQGVEGLSGTEVTIASDHHEIATFLALGAMTGGEVRVEKSVPHHFTLIERSFRKVGVAIEYEDDTAIVRENQQLEMEVPFTPNLLPKIEAAPWPYFPVDLLPPMIALATRARGVMQFWNKIYESGFWWIPELIKFGAHVVTSDPHRIIVFGQKPMHPAVVDAPYIIRAAIALYMAAASIEGESLVRNADSIRRAHPNFVRNLKKLGADTEWEE